MSGPRLGRWKPARPILILLKTLLLVCGGGAGLYFTSLWWLN